MGTNTVLLYKDGRQLISRTTMHVEAGNNTNLESDSDDSRDLHHTTLHGRLQSLLAALDDVYDRSDI